MAINSSAIFQTLTEMLRSQERRDATNKSLALQSINMAYERDEDLERIQIAKDAQTQSETYQSGMLESAKADRGLREKELALTSRTVDISEGQLELAQETAFKQSQLESQLLIDADEEDLGKNFYNTFLSGFTSEAWVGYELDGDYAATVQQNPNAKWLWPKGRTKMKEMLGNISASDKNLIINRVTQYLADGQSDPKLIVDVAKLVKKNIGTPQTEFDSKEGKKYFNWIEGLGNAGIIYSLEPDKTGFGKNIGFGKDSYANLDPDEIEQGLEGFDESFQTLQNIELAKQYIAIEGMQARMHGDYKTDVDIVSLLEGGAAFLQAGGTKPITIESSLAPYKPGSDEYFQQLGETLFTPDDLGASLQDKYGFSYNSELGAYDFTLKDVDYNPESYQDPNVPFQESAQYEDISGDMEALMGRIEVLNSIKDSTVSKIKTNTTNPDYSVVNKGQDDYMLYEVGKVIEVLENQSNILQIKKMELEPLYLEQQLLQKKN
jgi:hypothetical protein|tara:strand:+ start:5313 stop:6791 length:1479 start_codon:yes stop_codon:yes gene_type:complete